jgi:hypothetical protein
MSAQPADQYGRPYGGRPAVAPAPAARTRPLGLLARVLFTLLGAAGMIIGGFLNWTNGMNGVEMSDRAFYQTSFVHDGSFVTTVGFAMIALGLVALIGLSPRSGWLTRLAGALGIVGFVLFVIQLTRANASMPGSIDMGAWIALAGSVVALIGGFFGTRAVVVAPAASAATTTAVE